MAYLDMEVRANDLYYNHLLLISPCDVDFQAQWPPKYDFPPESMRKASVADYMDDLLQI